MDRENEAAQGAPEAQTVASPARTQPKSLTESDALAALKAKQKAATAKTDTAQPKPEDGPEKPQDNPEGDDPKPEGEDTENPEAAGGEEADQQDDDTEEPVYTVKVNGEARQVPLSELLQTYSSARHIQSKQDAVLAQEREITTRKQEVDGLVTRYQQQLGALSQMMRPNLPDQRQLDAWLHAATVEQDPAKKAEANTNYLRGKQAIDQFNAVNAEQQRVGRESQAKAMEERQRYEATQADLLKKASPDFANPQYATKVTKFLTDIGFDDATISEIGDHRAWLMIDDARKWRERNQNIGKGVRKAVKEAKALNPSGNPAPKPDENVVAREAAKEAFRSKPTLKTALERLKAGQQPIRS